MDKWVISIDNDYSVTLFPQNDEGKVKNPFTLQNCKICYYGAIRIKQEIRREKW